MTTAEIVISYPITRVLDPIQYVDNVEFHESWHRKFNVPDPDIPEPWGYCIRFSRELERSLFLRLNYARYRASIISRSRIDRVKRWMAKAAYYKDIMMHHNLPLAMNLVRRTPQDPIDMEDKWCEACAALSRSIDKFDIKYGYKFSTYATISIRYAIAQWYKRRAKHKMLYTPDFVEFGAQTSYRTKFVDIDNKLDSISMVMDNTDLSPHEQLALMLRFGLCGKDGHTWRGIGNELGCSHEQARKIYKKAIDKLRAKYGKPEAAVNAGVTSC